MKKIILFIMVLLASGMAVADDCDQNYKWEESYDNPGGVAEAREALSAIPLGVRAQSIADSILDRYCFGTVRNGGFKTGVATREPVLEMEQAPTSDNGRIGGWHLDCGNDRGAFIMFDGIEDRFRWKPETVAGPTLRRPQCWNPLSYFKELEIVKIYRQDD